MKVAGLLLVGAMLLAAPCRPAIAAENTDATADVAGPRPALGRHERDRDRLGWYVPDFAKLQVAGFLGSVGVGVGYAAFNDVLNVSGYYGFTPSDGVSDSVHAAKLSFDLRPFELRARDVRFVPIYLGGGLLYAFGGQFFTRLPARYRRIDTNYYPPTAVHWLAQAGVEADYVPTRGPFERHGLYFEIVALDSYLVSYLENPKHVRLTDTLASSIGYRVAF